MTGRLADERVQPAAPDARRSTVAPVPDGPVADGPVRRRTDDRLVHTGQIVASQVAVASLAAPHGADLAIGAAGVLLGPNRHGSPVTIRLFRPIGTRVTLVGSVRAAQLVALRALALGAAIVVQTTRQVRWGPFTRAAVAPGERIRMVPPGRAAPVPAGTPGRPVLLVVDAGPVGPDPSAGSAWVSTLVVRDELTAADVEAIGQADLVILQQLRPDEAALAGAALGLGDSADWLCRIRDDMVGVVHRRSVRWALVSATPVESQLVAAPAPR